jgi:hypothetical protein
VAVATQEREQLARLLHPPQEMLLLLRHLLRRRPSPDPQVTSAPDDVSGRVPNRSDLSAAVDPARKCLQPLDLKLIGALVDHLQHSSFVLAPPERARHE